MRLIHFHHGDIIKMNIVPDIKGIIKYLNIKEKLIVGSQILGSVIFLAVVGYVFFIGIK